MLHVAAWGGPSCLHGVLWVHLGHFTCMWQVYQACALKERVRKGPRCLKPGVEYLEAAVLWQLVGVSTGEAEVGVKWSRGGMELPFPIYSRLHDFDFAPLSHPSGRSDMVPEMSHKTSKQVCCLDGIYCVGDKTHFTFVSRWTSTFWNVWLL